MSYKDPVNVAEITGYVIAVFMIAAGVVLEIFTEYGTGLYVSGIVLYFMIRIEMLSAALADLKQEQEKLHAKETLLGNSDKV